MGLDMYFYAERQKYESQYDGDVEYPEALRGLGGYVAVRGFRSKTTTESYKIGYFRKFNALHGYIVDKLNDGVDDCKPIFVGKEDLERLLAVCEEVQADHDKAPTALPTTEGFFFGATEYDDLYFGDVDDAVELFKKVLADVDFDEWSVYYAASW